MVWSGVLHCGWTGGTQIWMSESLSNLLQIFHPERQVCCSHKGSQNHELENDGLVDYFRVGVCHVLCESVQWLWKSVSVWITGVLGLLVIVFLQSREISGFRYFMKMVSKFTMEELKCVSCVSIANDDENIEAHKICLRKQSNCGNGTMLKIQTSCYRFRKLATDSGILLWIQASCYRFRHLATDSGILLIA